MGKRVNITETGGKDFLRDKEKKKKMRYREEKKSPIDHGDSK